jgi:transcriptional regulator with XRE-family HTH domain
MSIAGNLHNTRYRNIFFLLKRRGITQSDFAAAIDVARAKITDWKAGWYNPTIPQLIKIANYFDVSVDFLLGRCHEENRADVSSEIAHNLAEIVEQAEIFADEAVERYGVPNRYAPLSSALKCGIEQLIETLE